MEQSPAGPFIDIRGVTKVYHVGDVDVHALRGVDLQIKKGELCCIVGRSGSGKSTLLNVLAGLERVTAGEITIAGQRLDKMSEAEMILFRQKYVGFVFQSFNLMPYYTALENVAFPLSFRGMPQKERNAQALDILTQMGLETHQRHKPAQLSGGQQQRVGIARALVGRPELVFADEPTGNLDFATSDEVMHSIRDICRAQNKTLIMVTHDQHIAEFADRTIQLLDGRVVDS
ncbi:MAG: ABC transporter ATP-binding protein [Clostridiales bacterium]|nr:ABC transporter ATP-binding protein [Clostridiales bacterium]